MSFVNLRNAINTKLGTVSKIATVYIRPTKDIKKFPCAIVVPSDNESIYETVTQNERDYGFSVFLVVNLKDRTVNNAYDAMYDLVDDVINAFDDDPYFTGSITLDSDYTMIGVTPAPAEWGQDDELQQLIARINLRCRLSYDTN